MLSTATQVVTDYGHILSKLDAGCYGHPISLLPHTEDEIREAILTSFREFGQIRPDVREGLIHGFVYLAQFVPDHHAEIIVRGQQWLSQKPEQSTLR